MSKQKIYINLFLCVYSPMFLQEGPHGTMILYIPSVFISYNGEALDEKSVLLRSSSIISKTALELLHLIEPIEEGKYLILFPYLNEKIVT
jgi:glutamine synthetase type III